MALISCRECEGKISTLAEICPHCGCPAEKETFQKTESSRVRTRSSLPLKTKKFNLENEERFFFKGKALSYDDISSLSFHTESNSLNGATLKGGTLTVTMRDQTKVFAESVAGIGLFDFATGAKKLDQMSHAYAVMSELSFESRLSQYRDLMKRDGFIDYKIGGPFSRKKIRIHADGRIEKGKRSVQLGPQSGYHYVLGEGLDLGSDYYANPYTITFLKSETKVTWLPFKFDARIDRDVLVAILASLNEFGSFE